MVRWQVPYPLFLVVVLAALVGRRLVGLVPPPPVLESPRTRGRRPAGVRHPRPALRRCPPLGGPPRPRPGRPRLLRRTVRPSWRPGRRTAAYGARLHPRERSRPRPGDPGPGPGPTSWSRSNDVPARRPGRGRVAVTGRAGRDRDEDGGRVATQRTDDSRGRPAVPAGSSTRWARSWSASGTRSSSSLPASSPAGTSCSRTCPASARRSPRGHSRRRSAWSSGGSSSPPTCCPRTSPARCSTTSAATTSRSAAGPVFTNLLLADEINRTPPKTQAALLEAMQEKQVSVEGTTYPLPTPFHVLATANPIEYEGTYPLPEAQLDRFLLRVSFGYPDADEEFDVLRAPDGAAPRGGRRSPRSSTAPTLLAMQAALEDVVVEDSISRYLIEIVRATRADERVLVGASPRGSLALLLLARAKAVLAGRDFVVPEDVKDLAVPALAHRITLRPEMWLQRIEPDRVVRDAVAAVAGAGERRAPDVLRELTPWPPCPRRDRLAAYRAGAAPRVPCVVIAGAAGRRRGPRAGRPGGARGAVRARDGGGVCGTGRRPLAAGWRSRPARRTSSRATTSTLEIDVGNPTTSAYDLAVVTPPGRRPGASDDGPTTARSGRGGRAGERGPTRPCAGESCAGAGTLRARRRPRGRRRRAAREQPGDVATAGAQGVSANRPVRGRDAMPNAAGLVGAHRSRRYGDGGELAGIRRFGPATGSAGSTGGRPCGRASCTSRRPCPTATPNWCCVLDVLHEAGVSGGVDGAASVTDTTVRAAAGIAQHYVGRGDRVRMLEYGGRNRALRAGTGRRHYLVTLEWLLAVAAGRGSARPDGGDSSAGTSCPGRVARRPDAAARPPQCRDAGPAGA